MKKTLRLIPFLLLIFAIYIGLFFAISRFNITGKITLTPEISFNAEQQRLEGKVVLQLDETDFIPANSYFEVYIDNKLYKTITLPEFIALSDQAGKGNYTQASFNINGKKITVLDEYNFGYGFGACKQQEGGESEEREEKEWQLPPIIKKLFPAVVLDWFNKQLPSDTEIDKCIYNWKCSEWSKCNLDYKQTRTCRDLAGCEDIMKIETKPCACHPGENYTVTCPSGKSVVIATCKVNETCKPICKRMLYAKQITADIINPDQNIYVYKWVDPCTNKELGECYPGQHIECKIFDDISKNGWYVGDTLIKHANCSYWDQFMSEDEACANEVQYTCDSFDNKYTVDINKLIDTSKLEAGEHKLKIILKYDWSLPWNCSLIPTRVPEECTINGIQGKTEINVSGIGVYVYWLHTEKPICGTDCKTYPNECVAKCYYGINKKFDGPCPWNCQIAEQETTAYAAWYPPDDISTQGQDHDGGTEEEEETNILTLTEVLISSPEITFTIEETQPQEECESYVVCETGSQGVGVYRHTHTKTMFIFGSESDCASAKTLFDKQEIDVVSSCCRRYRPEGGDVTLKSYRVEQCSILQVTVNCTDEEEAIEVLQANNINYSNLKRIEDVELIELCEYGCAEDGVSCAGPGGGGSGGGGGGAGGGSGGGGGGAICIPNWSCTDWSPCMSDGYMYRTCTDLNGCDVSDYWRNPKPATKKPCYLECEEEWYCSEWSECINGIQTRECWDVNNCGTTYDKPATTRSCVSEEAGEEGQTIVQRKPWLPVVIAIAALVIALLVIGWKFGWFRPSKVRKTKLKETKLIARHAQTQIVPNEIVNYVKTNLKRGIDAGLIKQRLREAGWTEKQIAEAFRLAKRKQK